MPNPYSDLPDHAFWKRAVVNHEFVDPVVRAPFTLSRYDKIATAGSCFAQHISRWLVDIGYNYFVTEEGPREQNFGVFPARFGNIYSSRQLLQLFDRAHGLFEPADRVWTKGDRFVDPFRPLVENGGFETVEHLLEDRLRHFEAVRRLFRESDVFIFTLGLTEVWQSVRDGAVFPLAPGVAAEPTDATQYAFQNFTAHDVERDILEFVDKLRTVSPNCRVILTVSPVPLIATYESRHVLLSTTYSKSALRVAAEGVVTQRRDVAYFPSFEMITGAHARSRFFERDMRSVTAAGVDYVMRTFSRHFLLEPSVMNAAEHVAAPLPSSALASDLAALAEVVCDEVAIEA